MTVHAQSLHLLLRAAILLLGLALVRAERSRPDASEPGPASRVGLAALALGFVLALAWLLAGHLRSPFEHELMELTVLQHARRALHGLPLYPAPGPGFVALAYNPLYYVTAAPLLRWLGDGLLALRALSLAAFGGCLLATFLHVRAFTRSAWWGWMAVGLFAAAYKAMDAYLDTAHADGWMLLCALLGTAVLARARGGGARAAALRLAGTLLLVLAFWFKQHGALFALGGLAFLALRDGWRRAAPSWLLCALLGPALYVGAGNALFGPAFHRFTWDVPRGWSSYELHAAWRLVSYALLWYAALAVAALWSWVHDLRRLGREVDAWTFQLAPALLTGAMGALDAGSSDNVFIPLGLWLVLVGVPAFARLARVPSGARLQVTLLAISFALLAYNPLPLAVSPRRAAAALEDLRALVRDLPGTVYAPWIGELPSGPRLTPAAHIVALEDWIGPRGTGAEPVLTQVLAPALAPAGPAWVLANTRLESYRCLAQLGARYRLAADLGDRFAALRCVPRRFHHAWPRYLYRFEPAPDSAGSGSRSSSASARPSAGMARPLPSATARSAAR
jgi:hypothetical protein